MMTRYACFEIKTSCGQCGQPVPVNGPLRTLPCPSCFSDVRVTADTLVGFINDFEEEHEGYEEGQGSGGTMFSGAGQFEYGYWRLRPRCSECKQILPEVEVGTEGTVDCVKCGRAYPTFPAPPWLVEEVPSVVQCIGGLREGETAAPGVETEARPVAMSCPQCGGGLQISAASERIFACQFCETEVFVPDPIWNRLHPVATVAEWFLRFEGQTAQQWAAERRKGDTSGESAELKRWRPFPRRKAPKRWILYVLAAGAVWALLVLVGLAATAAVMIAIGMDPVRAGEILASAMGVVGIATFVVVTLLATFSSNMSYRWGRLGKCKRRMMELADEHGWRFDGEEHKLYMGRLGGKLDGQEFEVSPDDDYAIEVDLDESAFYLKSEPPGYPPDGMVRFTTGDATFDRMFPIRYAKPKMAQQLEESFEPILPFLWLRERWGDKLARVKVDWSDLEIHLAPGGMRAGSDRTRYLYPDEIEPLIRDAVALSKAIEAVSTGRDVKLPSS